MKVYRLLIYTCLISFTLERIYLIDLLWLCIHYMASFNLARSFPPSTFIFLKKKRLKGRKPQRRCLVRVEYKQPVV